MAKVLFQLYLDVEDHQYIQEKAEKEGKGMSAITRQMLKEQRRQEEEKQKNTSQNNPSS